jgi:DNA-directed RNA polymerase subunit alpha
MVNLKFEITDSKVDVLGNLVGNFVIENLTENQGLTIGNALRRVLLSHIQGTAITAIKIPGVIHEFDTIPGIRDDILEIFLNLKQVILKSTETTPICGKLIGKGPTILTAKNLVFDSPVEILNPQHYITTVIDNREVEFEIRLENGVGYHLPDPTRPRYKDFLDIDPVFMPVVNVKYKIHRVYKNNSETIELLALEITTDGSLTPEEALHEASLKLINWFQSLIGYEEKHFSLDEVSSEFEEQPDDIEDEVIHTEMFLIDDLNLPVRAYNCLKKAGITSVSQLQQYNVDDLKQIKHFGKKSANDVYVAVKTKFGIELDNLNF